MDKPEKGYNMNPCMDVYKAKIQYDESLENLKLIIVVRGYLQNKDLFGRIDVREIGRAST